MINFKNSTWISVVFLLTFTGILILNASYYFPFISDDSLISLRYASRLLHGDGLTWTDGRPIEGYSNLLWILLIAIPGMLGVDLIDAARILGILGMAIIMASILYWYISKHNLRVTWFSLTIALLFLSLGAPIAVWAIGGLEQPLYGALLAVSIPLMYSVIESKKPGKNRLLFLSFILGLMCITRPDGPIFAAASAASLFIIGRFYGRERMVSRSFLVLLFPGLFYLGQLLFRILYYGELVPNPALVKITPSVHHFLNGLTYLGRGLIALAPFSILAIASLVVLIFSSNTRLKGIYLLLTSGLWSLYIVFIGGDIFPAYRHFIPLMVVFAFALVEGASIVVNRLINLPSLKYYFLFIFIGFVLLIPYTYIQFTNADNQRAIHERWEWKGKKVGLLLKKAFSGQQPLLAVTAAGCLPYWSELPCLDMMGLNDYYLPRNPPENIGKGLLGHELGDGKYVLSRKPDIIIFNVGSQPVFRTGYELVRMPEFHKLYSPIKVRTYPGKHKAIIYFNKYSDKIGILKSQSSITVPGFLFKGKNTIVYLNKSNRLAAQVKKGQSVRVTFDSEPLPNWFVDVKASDPDKIRAKLEQTGSSVSIELVSKSTATIEIEEVVLRSKY
ncbi:hypothetical protein ACFLRT_01055 [Acidobacteriota bacterium]